LQELGVADVGCLDEFPGVWVGVSGPNPRKICAIGVRLANNRTMHGFALNVATDMRYMRDYIVPCGIGHKPVTSLAEEGVSATLQEVADIVARRAATMWGDGTLERQDVAWKHTPTDLAPFSRGEGPGETGRALAGKMGTTALPAKSRHVAPASARNVVAADFARPTVALARWRLSTRVATSRNVYS
jgi:lipoic acid synthetase